MKFLKILNIMLCSLLFTFLFVFLGLKLTIFNEEYLINSAQKSDYYELLAGEINSSIQDIGMASNIPRDVLKDVVTSSDVKEPAKQYFRDIYLNSNSRDIDGTKIANRALEKVTAYAEENNLEFVTDDTNQFSSYVKTAFVKNIQLPYMTSFGQRVTQYDTYLNYAMIGCLLFLAFALFLLVVPLSRYAHQLYRSLSYVFSSVGLLLVTFPAVFLISGMLKRIAVNSESLYHLFNTYVTNICLLYLLLGIFCIVASVVLAFLSERSRKSLLQARRIKSRA